MFGVIHLTCLTQVKITKTISSNVRVVWSRKSGNSKSPYVKYFTRHELKVTVVLNTEIENLLEYKIELNETEQLKNQIKKRLKLNVCKKRNFLFLLLLFFFFKLYKIVFIRSKKSKSELSKIAR